MVLRSVTGWMILRAGSMLTLYKGPVFDRQLLMCQLVAMGPTFSCYQAAIMDTRAVIDCGYCKAIGEIGPPSGMKLQISKPSSLIACSTTSFVFVLEVPYCWDIN